MSRAIAILAVVLVALVGLDTWWAADTLRSRQERARLQPLVDPTRQIVPDRIRRVHLQVPGAATWVYERRGDSWRFPQYFDAYVHGERMQQLLEQLLLSGGTLVASSADEHSRFGVDDTQALQVQLDDGTAQLADLRLGHGIPGPAGDESYARLAGQQRVLHLHAHPARLLGPARPPLLDPHLLPRAETRAALVQVQVRAPDAAYQLRRVLAPLPDNAPPLPASEADRYRWVVEQQGRVDTCDSFSVRTWLAWIRNVRFVQLVPPQDAAYGLGSAGTVELIDEEGAVDRLQVGRQASAEQTYVGNDIAGFVSTMPSGRAGWLLPPPELLREPLPDPSPFESIP